MEWKERTKAEQAHPQNNKQIFTLGRPAWHCYWKQATHYTLAAHLHFSSLMFSEAALHYSWSGSHLRAVASACGVFEVWTTVCQGADGLTNVTSDWCCACVSLPNRGERRRQHGSFGRAAGPRQEAAAESRGNGIKKCLSRQTRAARVVVSVFSNWIKLKCYY